MKTFVDNSGIFHKLMNDETPQEGWVEVIDKYKRFIAPNGDIHTILADATPMEDWVEQDFDFLGQPDINYIPPYTALRVMNYPQITDQLDMLFHELKTNGNITADGDWFKTIESVKDSYPKPE